MPYQLSYILLNYGSLALVLAAMVAGVVLTKGTARTLLGAALAVEVVHGAVAFMGPAFVDSNTQGGDAFFSFSLFQTLLAIAPTLLVVAAAVVGARRIAAKDAVIAALTDPPTGTWAQPERSPDPRLLAD